MEKSLRWNASPVQADPAQAVLHLHQYYLFAPCSSIKRGRVPSGACPEYYEFSLGRFHSGPFVPDESDALLLSHILLAELFKGGDKVHHEPGGVGTINKAVIIG